MTPDAGAISDSLLHPSHTSAHAPTTIVRALTYFELKAFSVSEPKYELMRIEFKGDAVAKISEKTSSAPPVAADYR